MKKKLSGAAVRKKGHDWEREVAIMFRKLDPSAVRNVGEPQSAGLDIVTRLPLAIQCKCWGKCKNVLEPLKQAANYAKPNTMPVAIIKVNQIRPIAVLDLQDFMTLFNLFIKTFNPELLAELEKLKPVVADPPYPKPEIQQPQQDEENKDSSNS